MTTLEKHVKRGAIATPGKSDGMNTLKGAPDGKPEKQAKKTDISAKIKSGKC